MGIAGGDNPRLREIKDDPGRSNGTAFNPSGIGVFLTATVGCRLRLFMLIPRGDEMILHDLNLQVKISPKGEGEMMFLLWPSS